MRYQQDFGHELVLDVTASEDLPYYRFITIKEDGKLLLASEKQQVLAVTLPSVQDDRIKSDGSKEKRDMYFKGEFPHVLYEGTCYVETTDTDVKVNDRLMIDKEGKVKKHTPDTKDAKTAYESLMGIVGIVLDIKKLNNTVKLVKVYLKI